MRRPWHTGRRAVVPKTNKQENSRVGNE